jgi:hypothetical protein
VNSDEWRAKIDERSAAGSIFRSENAGYEIAIRLGGRKSSEYLRLEKWKRLKTRRLFRFLIPDLRLGMVLDGDGATSGAVLEGRTELSKITTTHVS